MSIVSAGLTGKCLGRFQSVISIASFFVAATAAAQFATAPPPGLSLKRTGLGHLSLIITNGWPTNAYEIQFSTAFPSVQSWMTDRRGVPGQTNFITVPPNEPVGFYRARPAHDWDGDGVPNYLDVHPEDPRFGLLQVTIDTPRHGTLIE